VRFTAQGYKNDKSWRVVFTFIKDGFAKMGDQRLLGSLMKKVFPPAYAGRQAEFADRTPPARSGQAPPRYLGAENFLCDFSAGI
jgi:hypothetical protein